MTENSFPWPDNATGDAAKYTDDQWSDFWRSVFVHDNTLEGPIKGVLNELEVTGTTSPVSIDTGEAIVDGKRYINDATPTEAMSTPSAATSRIDLVVLRKSWSLQTVRVALVSGTESGSPSRPSLTQTDGVTWEIELAECTITDGGVITVVDSRTYAQSRLNRNRFAWAFQSGKEGSGVIADAVRSAPIRSPAGITSVTLDKATISATVSGSITISVWSAAFSTSGIPATEVSDSAERIILTTAFAVEKATFSGSWDLVWNSGDELFIEVEGIATTIEQSMIILEGEIQP